VTEYREVREVGSPADAAMCERLREARVPRRSPSLPSVEQNDALVLVEYEPLDEHEADEGLAEADAVAEQRASMLTRDVHKGQ